MRNIWECAKFQYNNLLAIFLVISSVLLLLFLRNDVVEIKTWVQVAAFALALSTCGANSQLSPSATARGIWHGDCSRMQFLSCFAPLWTGSRSKSSKVLDNFGTMFDYLIVWMCLDSRQLLPVYLGDMRMIGWSGQAIWWICSILGGIKRTILFSPLSLKWNP